MNISVVICCHNSAKLLPETLAHLARQKTGASLEWEVIVVDNASTDDTEAVARSCPESLQKRLRVTREPKAGLSHARIRGIHEARFEVISFIDDDNWVCENWLATIEEIFARHPEVGVAGGPSEPAFENPPPLWFDSIKGFYAVGPQHPASGDITDAPGTLLWGAGLSMRRAAILALIEGDFRFLQSGRSGGKLLAGEDTEICFALRESGWKLWYDERLKLRHFMTVGRLTWPYARKLIKGMGMSSVASDLYLIALNRPPFDRQADFKKTWLFRFGKAVKNLLVLAFSNPAAFSGKPPGSPQVLGVEMAKGQIISLLNLRSCYHSLVHQIQTAGWNKRKL